MLPPHYSGDKTSSSGDGNQQVRQLQALETKAAGLHQPYSQNILSLSLPALSEFLEQSDFLTSVFISYGTFPPNCAKHKWRSKQNLEGFTQMF